MGKLFKIRSIDWKPSPVIALATNVDGLRVAASPQDGSMELWLVSPGSIGWHSQLTIHEDPNKRVSSLVWCPGGSKGMPCGRLFSSNMDGSVSSWGLFHLKQKTMLDSDGVSIWQMVVAPPKTDITNAETNGGHIGNGYVGKFHGSDDHEDNESDEDSDSADPMKHSATKNPRVVIGFDDECLRIYDISDADEFIYDVF